MKFMIFLAVLSAMCQRYVNAAGVKCFVCDTSRSNEECTRNGRVVQCMAGMACMNEVRKTDTHMFVWKRCKQMQACNINSAQTEKCDIETLGPVCRSCCNTDRCNSELLYTGEQAIVPAVVRSPPRALFCPTVENPQNGRISCNFKKLANEVGTQCHFSCEHGYDLIGDNTINCITTASHRRARFNKRSPICRRLGCASTPSAPPSGTVRCADSSNVGSVCTFACEVGYSLVGSATTICGSTQTWSNAIPICEPIVCLVHTDPDNGRVDCTNENQPGSECRFTCNEGFQLSQEADIVQCSIEGASGTWNNPAPTCIELVCTELNRIDNGQFSCSNSNHFNSTCILECNENEGYFPSPSNTEFRCLNGIWNASKPCCTRSCPPYTEMDLVVILDSSSSVGLDNWNTMKRFARSFVDSFVIGAHLTKVSVIRYNKFVDDVNQILLRDFPDDRTRLLTTIENLPYEGMGTKTGQALRYVKDVLLQEENGDRRGVQDVALIVTDGRSQDNVSEIATQLRENGVLLYVIGVEPSNGQGLDQEQLLAMAGSPDHLHIATAGFSGLNESILPDLSQHICRNLCANLSPVGGFLNV